MRTMKASAPGLASTSAMASQVAHLHTHVRQVLPSHRRSPSRCPRRCRAASGNEEPKPEKTEAQKILEEAEALMAAMASGSYKPPPKKQSATIPDPAVADAPLDPSTGLRLHCDVNGCVIVPLSAKQPRNGLTGKLAGKALGSGPPQTPAGPRDFHLAEGAGWKLGYDHKSRSPGSFSALVGGDDWSIALNKYEYDDFIKLLRNLRHSVATLEILGEWGTGARAEDEAALELKTDRIWMEGRAQQKRLSALQDFWTHKDEAGREVQLDADIAAFEVRFIVSSPNQRDVEGRFPPEVVTRLLDHLDAQDKATQVASSVGATQSPIAVNA